MAPVTSSSAAELQLADQARQGDHDALVELYRRYRQPLYRHARRMLLNDAAAQDVVQEAFARAIAAMPRTREGELRFKAWIYRIATNLCLKQLNRGARWSRDSELPLATTPSTGPGADPERGRRRAEIAELVADALEQLPPNYRQILLLRELEELSYDELADALELDRNRVKVTLHRARARFAALFVAAQLEQDRRQKVACDELRGLLERGGHGRQLVAHLESCPDCRKREQRPAAELFALLPPLPPVDHLTPPVPGGGAAGGSGATAAAGGSASVGSGFSVGIVLAALIPAGVVTAVLVGAPRTPVPASVHRQQRRAAVHAAAPAPRPRAAAVARPPATPPRVAAAASAARPRPSKRPTSRPTAKIQPRPAPLPELRLKLRLSAAGAVVVRRGSLSFTLRKAHELANGDVLLTRPGRSLGLLLPGARWLALQGKLRLAAIPVKGARCPGSQLRCPVEVELLQGKLRAKANSRGGAIVVRAGASRLTVEGGEAQLELAGASLLLESLDAYVQVKGPHAHRMVPPRTHLGLTGGRPGFTHKLLPPPRDLRPATARGHRPPLLRWQPVVTARGYRVRIARDAQFMELERSLQVQGTQLQAPALPPGKHFWQVAAIRAQDGAKSGMPSKIYSFVVE